MANLTKYFLAIIVLLIFSHPAMGAEVNIYLTNQDGVQTTQFSRNDSVYIEGSCPVAPSSKDGIRIYIAFDKTWVNGDKLSDVSSAIESLRVTSDIIPRTLIWRNPLNNGVYDVVIDANNDLVLQSYENCIIGAANTGFRVGNAPPPPPAPLPPPPPPLQTAPPLPAPLPAPSALPEPPQVFSLEDNVEVKSLANVRKSPGGLQLGQQYAKSQGIIIGGPVKANLGGQGLWFWNIDFKEGQDGWVADQTLIKAQAKPADKATEEPKDEPVEEKIVNEPKTEILPEALGVSVQNQETKEKERAQVLDASNNLGMNQLMNTVVMGLAILLGLVIGSSIIARAIRKD